MLQRRKIAMVAAEFLGVAVLTGVFLAVSKSNIGIPYFVSLAAGLTLAAATFILGASSGAHLNPAVTIGLWTARRIKAFPALVYIVAQLLGGLMAYLLYSYLADTSLQNVTEFSSRILVAEAAGAFILAFGWAAVVYNKMDDAKRAFVIGASFTAGILVASIASAGLVNPAIALGMRAWELGTYVLGPILGAIIGFNLYALLFAPTNSLLAKNARLFGGRGNSPRS